MVYVYRRYNNTVLLYMYRDIEKRSRNLKSVFKLEKVIKRGRKSVKNNINTRRIKRLPIYDYIICLQYQL